MAMWKEKPDSIGDWLWVNLMACDCCVDECGVAYVFGESLKIDYCGNKPRLDRVHGWMKLESLPETEFLRRKIDNANSTRS